MRVQLNRERNNEFVIPDSFINKNRVRIMGVYENEKILDPEEYAFMGPRKIKMLRDVDTNSKIYGKIMEIRVGNRLLPR